MAFQHVRDEAIYVCEGFCAFAALLETELGLVASLEASVEFFLSLLDLTSEIGQMSALGLNLSLQIVE